MIVLLELLTALLEYIYLILQLSFSQQEFTLSYKYLTYYAGIMLNAFRYLLCSKLGLGLGLPNRELPGAEHQGTHNTMVTQAWTVCAYLSSKCWVRDLPVSRATV